MSQSAEQIPAAVGAFILTKALEQHAKDRASVDALIHIRNSYFEEYTDAWELDDEFTKAFEAIFGLLCPSGEDRDGRMLEDYLRPAGRA